MEANKEKYQCINPRHRETGLLFPCKRCKPLKPQVDKQQDTTDWEEEFEKFWRGKYGFGKQVLKDFIESIRQKAQQEERERICKIIEEMGSFYPSDVFPEPWDGWQKDVDELAKSKGKRIDNISGNYARWQEKVTKDNIIKVLSNQ